MRRNKFSLSNTRLFSCDMGELVPMGLTEVLPGDSFQHSTNMLVRVSPFLAPVMHPVRIRIHHWFVPHRIIWDDWESFITGGDSGFDQSVFPTIQMPANQPAPGTLADYLGVPLDTATGGLSVSALPFRAYNLIFNEWYRDQDLVDKLAIGVTSGPDAETTIDLQNVAWEKDYFTSARPWTQKGPEVTIPLQGDAPILGLGKLNQDYNSSGTLVNESDGTTSTYTSSEEINESAVGSDGLFHVEESAVNPGFPDIRADLSGVSAANINELRLAFALQRYEEARARYGSRYTEYLAYLGVRSSDARLQRPEYLGGGKQTIQFSEVLATAQDDTGQPEDDVRVGDLKGHGMGAIRSNRYRRYFEEHGYIISLVSVLPKTIYTQGLSRTWNRRTKEDFWQKELEHIGQQEILKKEIFAEVGGDPNGIFGYQDRYDEYRRNESTVAGEFRTDTLDFWHMARVFESQPVLNSSFVTSDPTKRINAVQTEDVLWCMANHSMQARRMISKQGTSFIL